MSRNEGEEGNDGASNDDRGRVSRRDWMKTGAAGVGASMLGLTQGMTPAVAATTTESNSSYNLTPEVPERAMNIWQEAPDDARDKWGTKDASAYDGRSGDLTELIHEASKEEKIVNLGSGTYEMKTSVEDWQTGDLRGIAGDGATVYITTTGTAFPLNDGTFVIEGVTFDITETSDVALVAKWGTGFKYGLFRDIELRGQRRRVKSGEDGHRYNFMINAKEGGECLVENVSFLDGGVEVDGVNGYGDDPKYAIPIATDPPHEGYTVFKNCQVEDFNDNGFYIRNAPGTSVLWNCTARNNARSNMRPGEGDVIVGGLTEVNNDYAKNNPEMTGVPLGHDGKEFDRIVGLKVIAEGDRWGRAGLQTFGQATGGTIEKTVFWFKSGNSMPIEIGGINDPHFTMNNIWLLDESSQSHTFDIVNWSKYSDPKFQGSLTLGDDVRVDTNATDAFRIGSDGTLTAPDGSTYSSTSRDASDIGVDASLTEDDLPEFYFDYENDDQNGSDGVIDDFESGNLGDYSYDDEATVSSGASHTGTYGLDLDGNSNTSGTVRSDSGLGTYPAPDDIWEFWWNPQTTNQNFNVNFALQSGDLTEGFRVNVSLDDSNQLISFQERGSSGDTYLGQADLDIQTGTWYRTIVDGSGTDGWSVHVDTGEGSSVVGEFTTDATQYTGYGKSGIAYWISGADRVFLDDIATRDGNPLNEEETPGTVVDDFEDGSLSEYTVTGTDGAGTSDAAAYRGSYGLELDGASGGSGTVRSDTGLNAYPGQNDRWEFWWNPRTESEFFRVTFAIQSDDRSEAFTLVTSLDSSNQFVQLEERGSNGDSYLGHADLDLSTDTWYRTVVDGRDSDGWTISVDTGEGTTPIGEFTSDPTQYTWYDRSSIAYWISGTDHVSLDDVTIREIGADADGVPGTVVDNFEDGELSDTEYTVTDTTGASVSDAASYRGSYGLELDGPAGGSGSVRSDAGLNAYPGQNDRWEFWWNTQVESEFFRVTFAIQSDDRSKSFNLLTRLDSSNQYVQLQERGASGDNYLGHADLDLSPGTWYRTVIDGTGSDSWTISVDTGEGTTKLGEFTSESTQYTWYDRSGIAYWFGGSVHTYIDDVTIREIGADAGGVPGTIVDDFEYGDGTLDQDVYTVTDTTGASVSDAASYRGSYGLELDGASGGSGTVRSDSGLNAYPGQNDKWEFWWNTQTESEFFRVTFAIQSNDRSESLRLITGLNSSNQYVQLQERGANGDKYLGHADLELSPGTWYRTVVDGTGSDDWTISVDTGEGTATVGEFTSEPTQYTWYDRSSIAYWISGTDHVYLDDVTIRTEGEPSDDEPNLVVDDFEDGDLAEWTIPSQTGTVDTVTGSYDGSYALRCYDDGLTQAYANESNSPSVDYVPQPGDLWEFYVKLNTTSSNLTRFYFGRQGIEDDAGQYEIQLISDGTFRLVIDDGGSNDVVGTGTYDVNYDAGRWYRVRHWWQHPDKSADHVCELSDVAAGTEVATVSGDDGTWLDGDVGVWVTDSGDTSFDHVRILDRTG